MLSLVARAEVEGSWDAMLARCARALDSAPVGALCARLRPRSAGGVAWIDLGLGDPLRVELREGLLIVYAATGAWGPGYHECVVRVLDVLSGALDVGWSVEDPSGFFARRDRGELERAFLEGASRLWRAALAVVERGPACVGLALGEGPAHIPPGHVAAPTGFKTRAWIDATCAALEASRAGAALSPEARRAFLWWAREPEAQDWAQLGRALATNEVIWRATQREESPAQVEVRERALTCFLRALELCPRADVPHAWVRRLAELSRRALRAPLAARPAGDSEAPTGYREGWVRRPLGNGWNLALPGWLRASVDDDGHDVFWSDSLTVIVSARASSAPFQTKAELTRHLAALPLELARAAQVETLARAELLGYALVIEPEAPSPLMVQGQVASGRDRLTFTIVVHEREVEGFARELAANLRPVRAPSLEAR